MTVRIYKSTDASAPVLTGQVGKLTDLLDAVLVNGYGSQTAAGWTIAYTSTNRRQYAMAASGTDCQLFVDDNGPGAGAAKEARFCGFKTGSAIGAGTGQFPTGAQSAIGIGLLVCRKSTTADATARVWTIIADGHTIYIFIETGDYTAPLMALPVMFGDFFSVSSTDTSNCMVIGRTTENTANAGTVGNYDPTSVTYIEPFAGLSRANTSLLSNVLSGHFCASQFTNTGSSLAAGKHTNYTRMGISELLGRLQLGYHGYWTNGTTLTGATWTGAFNYPNPADAGMYLEPIWIHHGGGIRGYLKGLWAPMHHLPLGHGATFSGSGNMAGKSFLSQSLLGLTNMTGAAITHGPAEVHIEYSDTWS